MLRTEDAVSAVSTLQVATTLAGFFLVYSLLGIVGYYLIIKHAKQGPQLENA